MIAPSLCQPDKKTPLATLIASGVFGFLKAWRQANAYLA